MTAPHSSFFAFLSLLSIFLFPLSFVIPLAGSGAVRAIQVGSRVADVHRRILHQPFFPENSPPPSATESPPSTPETPGQPFFPEVQSTPYQIQSPPPPATGAVDGGLPISPISQPVKPGKKVVTAISVGIVTLGMLSALAFFLYRHKVKHGSESQKFVNGVVDGGSHMFEEDPRPPSSNFLYIGTVEPSRGSASESNGGSNGAVLPYRKLNSVKISDRYRPSPELQPLPPLAKPPRSANSPSVLSLSPSHSSSDEASRDTAFYTPHRSTISNFDGYYTQSAQSVNGNGHSVGSVPHSKRTAPRFATKDATVASLLPEMKHVIIPSIKQKSPRPVDIRQELPDSLDKPKFSPPPPPPPQKRPADFQIQRKHRGSEVPTPTTSKEPSKKQEFRTPSSKSKHDEEINGKSAGSSEKTGDGETELGRPNLKPVHWDKVRARSDRATVWDQLQSSSFQYETG